MTTDTDIANRALQSFGSRTTIASLTENSNEAIQASLIIYQLRDDLLRMAPWNCATNFANLTLITAAPGTPENQSQATTLWQKGQPPPPWAYEYQYPVDCLRPLFIVPQFQTGFAGGVPITTAVTGGAASFWQGPPVKFKVAIDQFVPVISATVAGGGAGYVVGDLIYLPIGPITSPPIGAPAILQVATIGGGGSVATVNVVNQVLGSSTPQGGSYFSAQPNPVSQSSTSGSGVNGLFNLTYGPQASQRVILTNQEFALLSYLKQITDPNIMDSLFQDAWVNILGARLILALSGDKTLANMGVQRSNEAIMEARKADGNEGLTINDVTPDWIRTRGIVWPGWQQGPNQNFDWGPMWAAF